MPDRQPIQYVRRTCTTVFARSYAATVVYRSQAPVFTVTRHDGRTRTDRAAIASRRGPHGVLSPASGDGADAGTRWSRYDDDDEWAGSGVVFGCGDYVYGCSGDVSGAEDLYEAGDCEEFGVGGL